jgi:hypothetical protein
MLTIVITYRKMITMQLIPCLPKGARGELSRLARGAFAPHVHVLETPRVATEGDHAEQRGEADRREVTERKVRLLAVEPADELRAERGEWSKLAQLSSQGSRVADHLSEV